MYLMTITCVSVSVIIVILTSVTSSNTSGCDTVNSDQYQIYQINQLTVRTICYIIFMTFLFTNFTTLKATVTVACDNRATDNQKEMLGKERYEFKQKINKMTFVERFCRINNL